jgi:hypothetical protein
MALTLPNGSSLAIASTYGASYDITAITNATEAVASVEVGHGLVAGDLVEVTSGWADLDGKIVRVKLVDTNEVTLEDINSTNLARYPAGSGVGSLRKITDTTAITQILSFATEGGDQQFYEYQFLEATVQRQIPSVRSPLTINMVLADDQSLPWFAAIKAASDARQPRALLMTLASGAKIYYNAFWSLNEVPTVTVNEAMGLQLSLALVTSPTRYAS